MSLFWEAALAFGVLFAFFMIPILCAYALDVPAVEMSEEYQLLCQWECDGFPDEHPYLDLIEGPG